MLVWEGLFRAPVALLTSPSHPEQQLSKLSDEGSDNEPGNVSRYAEQIAALMSTKELSPMALERWEDGIDEVAQINPANADYDPGPGLVEVLSDLLTALRAACRTYYSRLVATEIREVMGDDV